MIPTNSSSSTNGCDNISSNCVIWQGPDIACINLCNGDTISEVISKLATEVCTLITSGVVANPSLEGLDLTCLAIEGVTPTQLVPVLQAMVVQICANTGAANPPATELPIMTLPACLVYNDALGNPVTQLRLDLFATLIAEQVCTNLSSINIINTTLTNITGRLVILENCVLPCTGAVVEAQVMPTCILPAVLTDVSVLLLALEVRFCSLETAVGLPAAILLTIQQSFINNTTAQLTNPGSNYGSIGGWNTTPVNLAQSVQNAWVVIDDMYNAISAIQLNCCPSGCESAIFDYRVESILTNGLLTALNFNFIQSSIPAAFNDCSGSTVITITDSNSVAVSTIVNVSSLQNNASGVIIQVPTLNTQLPLNASVAFCVTNGIDTCSETQNSVIDGVTPCPTESTVSATDTTATIGFSNVLGLTATYTIDILDAGLNIVATETINNPGAIVSQLFTGLTASTPYSAEMSIVFNGAAKKCGIILTFTTAA